MQAENFLKIQAAISEKRLEVFRDHGTSNYDVVCRYLWNTALSQSLYPSLQMLEVALRNTLQKAMADLYRSDFWFTPPQSPLDGKGQHSIDEALSQLSKQNKPPEVGRIVAELGFGFWTSLFNKVYEQRFVNKILKPAFPYLPKHMRTRSTLSKRLNDIRNLRNRVFHHERILHRQHLAQEHTAILETIGWINPEVRHLLSAIDDFPRIYAQGHLVCRQKVAGLNGMVDFSI